MVIILEKVLAVSRNQPSISFEASVKYDFLST